MFSPLYYFLSCIPLPSSIEPPLVDVYGSCIVITCKAVITSLASPFPVLFLTSRCLFCAYQLCFLFPVPFSSILPLPLPTNNPPCDLHFCDSVLVLVVCFLFYLCLLSSVVDGSVFVVFLLFIVFYLLFLR